MNCPRWSNSISKHHILFLFVKVAGHIFVSYNVGREDIAIGEMNSRVDDGKYHVVRFTRSGANSTLQLDEMQVQTKHPLGKFMD